MAVEPTEHDCKYASAIGGHSAHGSGEVYGNTSTRHAALYSPTNYPRSDPPTTKLVSNREVLDRSAAGSNRLQPAQQASERSSNTSEDRAHSTKILRGAGLHAGTDQRMRAGYVGHAGVAAECFVMHWHWLTTAPGNPRKTHGADAGQRGWRLHLVYLPRLRNRPTTRGFKAVCGTRPSRGWAVDLFIDKPCSRCERWLAKHPGMAKHVPSRGSTMCR